MIGREALLLIGHHHRASLGTHQHLVFGVLELLLRDEPLGTARGEQRSFVNEVGQIGAGKARRSSRDHANIDIRREWHLARVDLEDLLSAHHVRVRHDNLPVEATGPQQRRIKHVWAVGRGDQNYALVRFKPVHFHQQLVQRLLALIVASAKARTAMPADRVDFVDEDDTRRVLLRLLEHVSDAARADADEHLDEIRTGDREERHVCLTRDRACEQRLTRAWRANQ